MGIEHITRIDTQIKNTHMLRSNITQLWVSFEDGATHELSADESWLVDSILQAGYNAGSRDERL